METAKKQEEETTVIRKKLTQKEIEELTKLIGRDYIIKSYTWHLPPNGKKDKPHKND